MKNNLKKLLSVILCAVLLFTTTSTAFATEETRTVVDSGFCGAQGENLTWTLYDDGELVISGEGEMDWYYPQFGKFSPWYNYFDRIDVITVEEGVTSIGSKAFVGDGLTRYYKISLPESLQFVEDDMISDISVTRVPGQHLAICYAGDNNKILKIKQRAYSIKSESSEPVRELIYDNARFSWGGYKYMKVYFDGNEPEAFCDLVRDEELDFDFVAHYYSPDVKAEKLVWYRVINDKDKKIAEMNVGEYEVKEFWVNTNRSGKHYLRADVVDADGNVIVSSEKALIADVMSFGESVKLLFAEVVYVLWLFVGLPIFGAVALPVLELLNLFGYKI